MNKEGEKRRRKKGSEGKREEWNLKINTFKGIPSEEVAD
jgi:hypothetical protein